MAKIALKKWNDYQKRYVPLENKAIADVTDYGKNKIMQDKVSGQVNADIAQNRPIEAAPPGVDPSGGTMFLAKKNAIDTASKGAAAMVTGRDAAKESYAKGLQAVVDLGRGQSTDAQLGMQGLAEASVKQSMYDAYGDYEDQTALGNMAGAGAGLAAYGLNKYLSKDDSDK